MTKTGGKQGLKLGNRLLPPRFLAFLLALPLLWLALRAMQLDTDWRDAAAMSFDAAALAFLLSLYPLVRDSDPAAIRQHAQDNDANRILVLVLTTGLTLVVMAAITGELPGAQRHEWPAIAKLVGTLLLTWLFANTVYTLHYAHAFYAKDPKHGGDFGGLDFPGTKTPDYLDFAYFAFTLGMTFQTSDASITLRPVRRIALLHCFAAFIFNLGVIAFTINALSGGK
ncbi:MAG TPA: DUF1345 domain-containing protein [Novosphingobium sp.]|nr:DUF1345 domain-containing protein [Novosphingobium sp.]